MGDKADETLLQLLQCKSEIEQVKKAREECFQQMETCTLELDAIDDIISEKASNAKITTEGSQLDHIVKIMVSQGTLNDHKIIIKDMSDDAIKKLRDDLTNKAMLYLEQERTQKNKTEQENLKALKTDLHKVEQQLQDHMITSVSEAKVDEEDIDSLTAELINLRKRVQEYTDAQTKRTYQGEWAVSTYEPYQMEALSIVRIIVEELVEDVLEKVGASSPFEHMQYLEKLLLQSSKEQLAEEAILLLTHQTIMDIGVKWMNEVVTEMCLEIAQHVHKAAALASEVAEEIIISQLPVKKGMDSDRNEMLKRILHQMRTDRQQSLLCWRHTQLLTRWAKDGATKETVDYKKSSNAVEITLPQDVLLQNSARPPRGDDSVEEKVSKALSIKLQESKSIKNVSAMSFSPNGRYTAIGVTGQLFVYDNNKISLVSEVITKEKLDFVHLAWSLDSTYLLSITTGSTLECWHIFTGKITSSGLSMPNLIVQIVKDDCKLKGDLNLSADVISLPHVLIAEFYPTFSILGIQPWLVVGLSSGDIIKCQVMPAIQHLMTPVVEPVLKFGNDYSAELFCGHESPLVSIVFSDFTGAMISLDVNYNLFTWNYSKDGFSGYGWYTPQKCYKINFELAMYAPIPDVPVKIKYDDKLEKSQRRKTNAEKQQIYRRALTELQSVQTSHILWQELTNNNGSKQYYIPQETDHSDFPCHIAVKDKDQQLLSYVISTYQTIKVSPMNFLTCYQTSTGKELTLHLLYKHELVAPQGIKVSLDLTSVELSKSVDIDRKIRDNPSNLPYLLHKYINQ